MDIVINEGVSGLPSAPKVMVLMDQDDQVMNLESSTTLQLRAAIGGTGLITGSTIFIFREGKATVENAVFTDEPGAQGTLFEIQSAALDMPKLRQVFGPEYKQKEIVVNFRHCGIGE